MGGREHVGIPWAVVVGFVRLVTHAAVLEQPLPPRAAIERVRQWFTREHVQSLDPGPRHLTILERFFESTGVGGKPDDRYSPGRTGHRASVRASLQRRRLRAVPGLRWHNPLA